MTNPDSPCQWIVLVYGKPDLVYGKPDFKHLHQVLGPFWTIESAVEYAATYEKKHPGTLTDTFKVDPT